MMDCPDPEMKSAAKKRRREDRREANKAYQTQWYQANKETVKERSNQWRLANLEAAKERGARWRSDNRERYLTELRERKIVQRYAWTEGDSYDLMLARQGGHCADCTATTSPNGRALDVDHDHNTGVIRGIVCRRCNCRRAMEDRKAEGSGETLHGLS
jgi:hypothetical protein